MKEKEKVMLERKNEFDIVTGEKQDKEYGGNVEKTMKIEDLSDKE